MIGTIFKNIISEGITSCKHIIFLAFYSNKMMIKFLFSTAVPCIITNIVLVSITSAGYVEDGLSNYDARRLMASELFKIDINNIDSASGANYNYNNWGANPGYLGPCAGYDGGHSGIDMQTKSVVGNNTTVANFYAISDGVVARDPDSYNTISIYNKDKDLSVNYLHGKTIYVKNGDPVKYGDLLGVVGHKGLSSGNHVHFEIRQGDKGPACGYTTTIDPVTNAYEFIKNNRGISILPTNSGNKSNGDITISGNGFGVANGRVEVKTNSYAYNASVSSWNDTNITANIFSDQLKWETFVSPVTVAVYKSDNITKVGESSYPFKDVPKSYWAANAIQKLYRDGVVSGKGNGQYDPAAKVTRSEFLTMLLRAKLGYALFMPGFLKPFDDVPLTGDGSWFAPYAEYAKNKAYVSGGTCSYNPIAVCFRPNDNISRFEASVMATNVFELTYYDVNTHPSWPDWNTFTHGYAPWIAFTHGIMSGYKAGDKSGYFGTNDPLLRDQAAVIVNNALKATKP